MNAGRYLRASGRHQEAPEPSESRPRGFVSVANDKLDVSGGGVAARVPGAHAQQVAAVRVAGCGPRPSRGRGGTKRSRGSWSAARARTPRRSGSASCRVHSAGWSESAAAGHQLREASAGSRAAASRLLRRRHRDGQTSALLPPKGAAPEPHDFSPANGLLPGGPRRGHDGDRGPLWLAAGAASPAAAGGRGPCPVVAVLLASAQKRQTSPSRTPKDVNHGPPRPFPCITAVSGDRGKGPSSPVSDPSVMGGRGPCPVVAVLLAVPGRLPTQFGPPRKALGRVMLTILGSWPIRPSRP